MSKYFAQLENNVVKQIIVADSLEWCVDKLGGEWTEILKEPDGVRIGDTYDALTDDFISPATQYSWTYDEVSKKFIKIKNG